MYVLKIKGRVPKNKMFEFIQSLNFMVKQFTPNWQDYYIAKDVIQEDIYYFDSTWESREELEEFMTNAKYKALLGTFKVLCSTHHKIIREIHDTKMTNNKL
jgi:quinol monooxygenase YgiN